eukprot:scaffold2804_cov371-Prasinococcus_capsulatus_cf.AAC.12
MSAPAISSGGCEKSVSTGAANRERNAIGMNTRTHTLTPARKMERIIGSGSAPNATPAPNHSRKEENVIPNEQAARAAGE